MGLLPSPAKCIFTDLTATNMPTLQDCFNYFIDINGRKVGFKLSSQYDWTTSALLKNNLTLLRGDILNGKWPTKGLYINEEEIKKAISTSSAPKTPKEKLDNLFQEICKLQETEGEEFMVNDYLFDPIFTGRLYFKNTDECNFYLKTLDDFGLINTKANQSGAVIAVSITFKGLNYNIELNESGLLSENCFVAMSFGDNMKPIRDAIKQAIADTGFKPLVIDELHFDAEKTINDEIIATIKKSRFCISDFTEQKDGVYFEAGYALGRGLKVIYTCHQDWFKQSHFDTNHFPHIIYKDPTDLYYKLKLKIEAWIS
jgi:nucleoside 2-deoxyribosyltransferase